MDIQKHQKQIDALQDCINNIKKANDVVINAEFDSMHSVDKKHLNESKLQLERCAQTLIGQLKLMAIQNREELES